MASRSCGNPSSSSSEISVEDWVSDELRRNPCLTSGTDQLNVGQLVDLAKSSRSVDQFLARLNELEFDLLDIGDPRVVGFLTQLFDKATAVTAVLSDQQRDESSGVLRATSSLTIQDVENEREAAVQQLRKESRYQYLATRKDEKMKQLTAEIHDDELMFSDQTLTDMEKRDLELKKQVLQLATEIDQARELAKVERYRIPEAKVPVSKVLAGPSPADEEQPSCSDQAKWEQGRMAYGKLQFGATTSRSPSVPETDKYQLVFSNEEKIEFEESLTKMQGNLQGQQDTTRTKSQTETEEVNKNLPIYQFREELIEAVHAHQILIVEGETGSGKTTQIPQYLLEAGFCQGGKKIGCTQPRRIAAMSVAARVASEMKVQLGNEVSYSIRFEDCCSERTAIKYLTDGMLLREFLSEPELKSYSVLIIDEAHERTLNTDILLGLVKDLAKHRPDLKVLISSATLDAEKFSAFFDNAPVFRIPGRRYPVDIYYTKAPEADYIAAVIVTVLQIHVTQGPGDILVFLTGQEEIETCEELLLGRIKTFGSKLKDLIVLPLFANLPCEQQAKVFEPTTPAGARKVILATNIAETSLTIDNVIYVIDSGFCKENNFNPRTGMESLLVKPISKAAAIQRAGRAGRVAPGKCFRLYTAWNYANEMEDGSKAEIHRVNLESVVLLLKSMGINDVGRFEFMERPPMEALVFALEQLHILGALNSAGDLTSLGRKMAKFPLDPMMSAMLVASSDRYACSSDILSIVAMLSLNNAIFYRPKNKAALADTAQRNFFHEQGDHMTLLNVYQAWIESGYSKHWCFENFVQPKSMKMARQIRDQLEQLMQREGMEVILSAPSGNDVNIRRAITAGYFIHAAKLSETGGQYKPFKHRQSQLVAIHPSSSLAGELPPPRWIIYHQLAFTSREFMRVVTAIEGKWLLEIAPHYFKEEDVRASGKSK